MEKNYLATQIKPDLKKLLKDKERLLKQIETCINLKHDYESHLNIVNNKIDEITYIIEKIKKPS